VRARFGLDVTQNTIHASDTGAILLIVRDPNLPVEPRNVNYFREFSIGFASFMSTATSASREISLWFPTKRSSSEFGKVKPLEHEVESLQVFYVSRTSLQIPKRESNAVVIGSTCSHTELYLNL
jgi:hypothetical protein